MQPPSNPADTFSNVAPSQRRTSPCRAARGVVTEEERQALRAAYLRHMARCGFDPLSPQLDILWDVTYVEGCTGSFWTRVSS